MSGAESMCHHGSPAARRVAGMERPFSQSWREIFWNVFSLFRIIISLSDGGMGFSARLQSVIQASASSVCVCCRILPRGEGSFFVVFSTLLGQEGDALRTQASKCVILRHAGRVRSPLGCLRRHIYCLSVFRTPPVIASSRFQSWISLL